MTDNHHGWPDETRPGVPLNPERDAYHWLRRRGSAAPEAWRWDPDADGCGTEYSGAWAEAEGDGQPADMARWFAYAGPCIVPADHATAVAAAYRQGLRDAYAAMDALPDIARFHGERAISALMKKDTPDAE